MSTVIATASLDRLPTDVPKSALPLPLPPFLGGTGIEGVAYRDRLISRPALAHWLGISPGRLGIWARAGFGPTPRRPGGVKVYYVIGDVLDFIAASGTDVCPDVRRTSKAKSENLLG
jgi:hypothetical protein